MGLYSKAGLTTGYKKNHKEREALDYYATPPQEVRNILLRLGLDFNNKTILDSSVGGGHIVDGIISYLDEKYMTPKKIIGTDIKDRGYNNSNVELAYGLDTLEDDYPYKEVDYVIINPPYSTIEPHVIRSLEIAKEGLLLLGRIQFLEGVGRYNNIFTTDPPSEVYVYVDRIKCYKGGDFSSNPGNIQAYCWFYWDMRRDNLLEGTKLDWIKKDRT